jgi:hypothetical protein
MKSPRATEETDDSEIERERRKTHEDEEEPNGDVTVDLADKPAKDDDEDPEDTGPAQRSQPTRDQKKQNRFKEAQERAAAAEARALQREEENRQLTQRLLLSQPQQIDNRPKQPDPYERAIEMANKEAELIRREFATLTPEEQAKQHGDYDKKFEEARRRAYKLEVEREFALRAPQQQRPQNNVQQEVVKTMITTTYPDIVNNPKHLAWADARHRQLQAEGLPDDHATLHRAMTETRTQFGLPGGAPSEATKAKFAGTSRGSNGGGGAPSSSVTLTRDEVKRAKQAYPGDPDALKKFAKTKARIASGQTS